MKTFTLTSRSVAFILGAFFLLSASAVFAAVQLSVSKQQVKTLKATLTYQDLVASPNYSGNSSIVDFGSLPSMSEIVSSFIKINTAFTSSNPIGPVGVSLVQANGPGGTLVTGEISTEGILPGESVVRVSDGQSSLQLNVGSQEDLNLLVAGSLDIYINYLAH